MTLWLDAQLPPLLAGWINAQGWGLHAVAVRDVGMRDASDPVIFQAARDARVVVMTKDRDFIRLLDEQGPPPQVQQRCSARRYLDHPAQGDGSSPWRRALG
jgi:predicted nuclease of predicted toxin-antitoxin system